jgi:hypothetical protein
MKSPGPRYFQRAGIIFDNHNTALAPLPPFKSKDLISNGGGKLVLNPTVKMSLCYSHKAFLSVIYDYFLFG